MKIVTAGIKNLGKTALTKQAEVYIMTVLMNKMK